MCTTTCPASPDEVVFRTDVRGREVASVTVTDAPPLDAASALAQVTTGLQSLAAIDPLTLSPDDALEHARVLLVTHDQLRALSLRAVADVHRRELFRLDDSP